MKTMNFNLILMIALAGLFFMKPANIAAQEKRALLIGINTYAPNEETAKAKGSEWKNLNGALNDVESIKSILLKKFGFLKENVIELSEEEASRQNILDKLEFLTKTAAKGDIVFVFYSGHGAQVRNSLSPEDDRRDEAIVPWDAIYGAKYIRDKELAPYFNRMADNGVLLTMVFDCCHSGSMTRGVPSSEPEMVKKLPMDTVDVKDPKIFDPPETRGALVFYAAKEDQKAIEITGADDDLPHGLFTSAFTRALRESGPGASANDVFKSAQAVIKYKGKGQEPDIKCSSERGNMTLFGESESAWSGKTLVAVTYIDRKGGTLELDGGRALGFVEKSQFRKVVNPKIVIEVTSLEGMAKSIARPFNCSLDEIKEGDLFEMVTWGIPDMPNLYIYSPPAEVSYQALTRIATELQAFCSRQNIKWVLDPLNEETSHFIFFNKLGWTLLDTKAKETLLGSEIMEENLAKYLIPGRSSLYFEAPPSIHMLDSVKLGQGSRNNLVDFTDDSRADYKLTGRWNNNSFEYCWILPGVSNAHGEYCGSLPLRTNWFLNSNLPGGNRAIGDSLTKYATMLGRIMAWMKLPSPIDGNTFPYRLGLKNYATGKVLEAGTVREGEEYSPVMIRDRKNLAWDGKDRYVYVFSIDIEGKVGLCFPLDTENNLLPGISQISKDTIVLSKNLIVIWKPFGNDTYFLLTSCEKIPFPEQVFNASPVKTKGNLTLLERFFDEIGADNRGEPPEPAPADWSLKRITVLSKPAGGP